MNTTKGTNDDMQGKAIMSQILRLNLDAKTKRAIAMELLASYEQAGMKLREKAAKKDSKK